MLETSLRRRLAALVTVSLLLTLGAGCAEKKAVNPNASAEAEYLAAKRKVDSGNYAQAAADLDGFASRHPYSKYAPKAEILRIFAAYKDREYVLSETLAERFIKRHPRHPDVVYAKYMLAMSHYRERTGPEHDPTQAKAAIEAFERLIREHPESEYARDGARYLQRLHNELASHELTVGRYYFDNKRYVAAANRFLTIVEKYQTTPSIEEALYYLAASYAELGLAKDARATALLLRHNYPRSPWSAKAKRYLGR